jgi:hypothetical protein
MVFRENRLYTPREVRWGPMTLREILAVEKRVTAYARARSKAQPTHEQYDLVVQADLPEGELTGFIRVSTALPESFSIGLVYKSEGVPPRAVLRVNGDHGGTHHNPDGSEVANCPHLHGHPRERIDWEPARLSSEVKHADRLEGPLTLVEAWDMFCDHANAIDEGGVKSLVTDLQVLAAQLGLDLL